MTAHLAADFMHYPGFETQLFNVPSAQLFLVDGEVSPLVERGDFVVRLAKQSRSPLAAVQASVGGVHWPLGKDSLTLKVKTRHYTFVLAGLMYGLVLPESTSTEVLEHLEVLLAQYSTFQVHLDLLRPGTQWRNQERPSLSFWTMVASELLGFSKKLWKEICGGAPLASSIIENLRASASESSAKGSNCASSDYIDGLDRPNLRSMKRVQRARRVSAVSKLLSRTLVQGALRASNHVAGLSPTQAKSGVLKDVVVASVDAISKIVEAVESTGVENHLANRNDLNNGVSLAEESSMAENASWTLSNTGLALLFHITAASAKIHFKSNSSHQASTIMEESSSSHRHNSDLRNSQNLCDSRCNDPAMSLGCPAAHQRSLPTRHFDSPLRELSSLPELSLRPSGPDYSSPANVTQQFLSTIGTSPAPPSQKPIISSGRTAFMIPSTYFSNMDTGGALSRKQFCHPN